MEFIRSNKIKESANYTGGISYLSSNGSGNNTIVNAEINASLWGQPFTQDTTTVEGDLTNVGAIKGNTYIIDGYSSSFPNTKHSLMVFKDRSSNNAGDVGHFGYYSDNFYFSNAAETNEINFHDDGTVNINSNKRININSSNNIIGSNPNEETVTAHSAFENQLYGKTYIDDYFLVNGDAVFDGDVTQNAVTANTINANAVSASGLTVTNDVNVGGKIHAVGEIKSDGFIKGNDCKIESNLYTKYLDVSNTATIEKLIVNSSAHFYNLTIDNVSSTEGQIIISAAHAQIFSRETSAQWVYLYYLAQDDEGNEIGQKFVVGDYIYCQTFGGAADSFTGFDTEHPESGSTITYANKFYWYRVGSATSTKYTKSGKQCYRIGIYNPLYLNTSTNNYSYNNNTYRHPSTNSLPSKGDEIVVLGNYYSTATNGIERAERRNAIIISSINSTFLNAQYKNGDEWVTPKAPYIIFYKNINSFVQTIEGEQHSGLDNKQDTIISANINKISATDIDNSLIADALQNDSDIQANLQSILNSMAQQQGLATTEQITALQTQITANADAITSTASSLQADINANTATLNQTQQTISAQGQSITVLQGQYNGVNGGLQTLSSRIDQKANAIDLTTLRNGVEQAGLRINGNDSKIIAKANTFEIQNQSGVTTTWVDSDGWLNSTGVITEGIMLKNATDLKKVLIPRIESGPIVNAGPMYHLITPCAHFDIDFWKCGDIITLTNNKQGLGLTNQYENDTTLVNLYLPFLIDYYKAFANRVRKVQITKTKYLTGEPHYITTNNLMQLLGRKFYLRVDTTSNKLAYILVVNDYPEGDLGADSMDASHSLMGTQPFFSSAEYIRGIPLYAGTLVTMELKQGWVRQYADNPSGYGVKAIYYWDINYASDFYSTDFVEEYISEFDEE